ncbi:MAG: 23S rRNA (uracil-5-)-methyltransferase RumA [Bacteroidetes bacterium GWA2_31_9b]|nr:MAG: 23S rRNA (uracil-5-)-methyltransferase RumA [Bacteroidetes bacterium GWA2_31_9b]
MGRDRRKLPIIESVEITNIAAEGKAIAKIDNKVIFVTQVIPGDVVDIQITRKRKSYMEGIPIRFVKYSERRLKPFCDHFEICGGCKWQNLPYEDQLKYKHQQVIDNLQRIAKVELPEINYILPSEKTTFYRNKLEFTFSNNRWLTKDEIKNEGVIERSNALGFHVPKLWDKIVNIDYCWLQPEPSNAIRSEVKKYADENKLSFFDLRKQEGLLRNLIIRTSSIGETMVVVVFFYEDKDAQENLLNHIAQKFPEITSLMFIVNSKSNDSITDQDVVLFKGKDHIYEQMEDLKFKIGPKSFYQTNSDQAYQLYKIARDFAGLTGNEIVYDLYTGTGTIANFVAHQAKKVIGIEYVPEAIEDAKVNSSINKLENTLFFAGDLKDILNADFVTEHGKPDVIITDPPRAGMHPEVVETIIASDPQRIVYVSCNPATQARDIQLFDKQYKLTKVQPVDMFPHTYHVENIVLLEKR